MIPQVTDFSVVITDGIWRKSLSAIRSLGKKGCRVHVMGDSIFTTGFWSKFSYENHRAPSAAEDAEAFGRALIATIENIKTNVVLLLMEDASLRWVSENINCLPRNAVVLLPGKESLAVAWDKAKTMEEAAKLGIRCPRTWEPSSATELHETARKLEAGRFVVKPREGSGSAGVVYGEHRTEEEWVAHWEKYGSLLLQERVPATGRGVGVSLLFDRDSNCVASFCHERLQQYPNSGGPSTDRHGIVAPELERQSIALLKNLKWQGIAMVEWKLDPSDNQPKLMEINPRFWGSLELAVRSGVDFPWLFTLAALNQPLPKTPAPVVGLRCRWLIPGDLLRYLTQAPQERESFRQFMRALPTIAEEWDLRDLRGALATLVCTASLALNPKYWKYLRRG